MAYKAYSKRTGRNVTKWKKDKMGHWFYTMWLRQSKKEGVYKWTTLRFERSMKNGQRNKFVPVYQTYLLDLNNVPQEIDGNLFYPIKVLLGRQDDRPNLNI